MLEQTIQNANLARLTRGRTPLTAIELCHRPEISTIQSKQTGAIAGHPRVHITCYGAITHEEVE